MELNFLKKDLNNDQLAKNQGSIIRYCKNKKELSSILSEGLFQAIDLYSKDTPVNNVFIMVSDLIEDYYNDPVEIIINVIKKIRKGNIKIYGRVTPHDLRDLITKELEDITIIRENDHHDLKGYSEQELGERASGRLSDLYDRKKLIEKQRKK